MKLTTITWVTIDGVMQGLGGQDEDRSGGFERGGWAMPYFDDEAAAFSSQVFQRADAFLFGRRTYEIFAGYWGVMPDPDSNPIAGPLNRQPKYVAATTLTEARWAHTPVLSGSDAIRELKAQPGGELQVHGSGELIRSLHNHRLVDEMILFTCPIIVGQGTRLFPGSGPDLALDLVESRTTAIGVTIQVYRPGGRPRYETAASNP